MPLILQPLPGYYMDNLSSSDNANSMCCIHVAQQRKIANWKNSDKSGTTLSTPPDKNIHFVMAFFKIRYNVTPNNTPEICNKLLWKSSVF